MKPSIQKRIILLTAMFLLIAGTCVCSVYTCSAQDTAVTDRSCIDRSGVYARRDILQKYRKISFVRQILLVTHLTGYDARIELYEKLPDESCTWERVFRTYGYIGIGGMGSPDEENGCTPLGDYGIRDAFGILDDPGTRLRYIKIAPTTFACSEDCPYYNQIIDTAETGHDCQGEEMASYIPDYNYGLATDTNPENIYPEGSALFIHCKGAKPYTQGCVAVNEREMITILRWAEPGMRIFYSEFYIQPDFTQAG